MIGKVFCMELAGEGKHPKHAMRFTVITDDLIRVEMFTARVADDYVHACSSEYNLYDARDMYLAARDNGYTLAERKGF